MGDNKLLKEMGERINAKRRELKMTQELLAEKMEVSVQMISNLELGKKAIRPENLVKLCAIIGVSADYILTGKHNVADSTKAINNYNRLTPQQQSLVDSLISAILGE